MQLPGPLVDPRWLERNSDRVVSLDVRWYLDGRRGRDAYDTGHIPGARFIDLDTDLSGPPTREAGRHPLPTPHEFAMSMGRLGVGNSTVVVAYDDYCGSTAGRCWWMLDAVGCAVAVLDGGIDAWEGPLQTAEPRWEPAEFQERQWPAHRLADIDEVEARTGDAKTVILDARSTERYRGDENPIDERYGHVPGALSAPFVANIGSDGRMLSAADLGDRFRAIGSVDKDVIVYCGSGVTACHDLLAMRAAGLGDGRLFVGSWSAWGADHDRPMETGD